MKAIDALLFLLLVANSTPIAAGDEPISAPAAGQPVGVIGILPFDAVTSEGYSTTASNGLAKMVRAEMIRDGRLVPKLLEPSSGKRPPLPLSESTQLGMASGADLVLAGSVLDSGVDRKSSKLTGGTDIWSDLGHVDFDDADWARTPVAKALRKAAHEIIDTVADHLRKGGAS